MIGLGQPPRHLKEHVHWAYGHGNGDQNQGSIKKEELGQMLKGRKQILCYKQFVFEQHTSYLI